MSDHLTLRRREADSPVVNEVRLLLQAAHPRELDDFGWTRVLSGRRDQMRKNDNDSETACSPLGCSMR